MDSGDYASAAASFQLALDQSTGVISDLEIDICFYKAAALYNTGDIEGAIRVYDAIIEYRPKNVNAYYYRGTMYLYQGESVAAMNDYNQALTLDGSDFELYLHIVENLREAELTDQASAMIAQALKLEANDTASKRIKGYFYYLDGDTGKAISLLKEAAEAMDEEAILYMVKIAFDSDDLATARTYVNLGLMVEEGAHAQEFMYMDAVLYEYDYDYETAYARFAHYLSLYPDDEDAQWEYTFLKTRVADDAAVAEDEIVADNEATTESEAEAGTDDASEADGEGE